MIDPPNLPAKPSFPDPIVFTGGRFGWGVSLGFLIILILEFRVRAIRTERDIEALLELPTLAVIPTVQEAAIGKRSWFGRKRKTAPAAVGATA